MKALFENLVENVLVELIVRTVQLPGKVLLWPVSLVVRIPPRRARSIELAVGLAAWIAVSLLATLL